MSEVISLAERKAAKNEKKIEVLMHVWFVLRKAGFKNDNTTWTREINQGILYNVFLTLAGSFDRVAYPDNNRIELVSKAGYGILEFTTQGTTVVATEKWK